MEKFCWSAQASVKGILFKLALTVEENHSSDTENKKHKNTSKLAKF